MFVCLGVFSMDVKAYWVIGHGAAKGSICNIIGGKCGDTGIEALQFFDREPEVAVAADVDVRIERGKMYLNIRKIKGSDKFFFDIEKDTPLDAKSASLLGYKSILVKKGKYSTCYSLENPNGTAVLDVVVK